MKYLQGYRNFLLSILSAVLLLVSFYCAPFLIFISFVPIFLLCYNLSVTAAGQGDCSNYRCGVFKWGFITGFIFGAGLMHWVLAVEAPIRLWLYLGVGLLFSYFGCMFGLSLWLPVRNKKFFLIPVSWTFVEFARSLSPQLGFPWGSIGYALVPYNPFLQIVRFVGVSGLTFFILTVNVLIFYAIQKKRLLFIYIAMALVFVVLMEGVISPKFRNACAEFSELNSVRVGIIQPNLTPEVKRTDELDYTLNELGKLSKKVLPCDLIIWPESAVSGYFNYGGKIEKVRKIVDSLNVPILLGSGRVEDVVGGRQAYNSSFLIVPGRGIVEFYDKRYLVPFSERFPFDDIFPRLRELGFGHSDYRVGERWTVFEVSGDKFSSLICFESIFPRVAGRFVREGAQFFVNITDDSWFISDSYPFGRAVGPGQHASYAVLRAIEYGVPLVRCAASGISFFLTACGKKEGETKLFVQETVVRDIRLSGRQTFYAKHGDWFAWLCGFVLLLSLLVNVGKVKSWRR